MKIAFYLKNAESTSETNVYARFRLNGAYVKYYTTESINPKFWNTKAQRAFKNQKFPQYPEFNTRLSDIATQIQKQISHFQNRNGGAPPTPKILKELLDAIYKPVLAHKTKEIDFFALFKELIQQSEEGTRLNPKTGRPLSATRIKSYKTAYKRLEAMNRKRREKINFETINPDFYKDYIDYLTKDLKLAVSTIGGQIAIIKLVMNEALERGLTNNVAHMSKRFKKPYEEACNIFLDKEELKAIEDLDLSDNPRLDRVRDSFLVGCYTGQRYDDFSNLTRKNIRDRFIYLTQSKTGKEVTIPIHRVVKKIIAKYDGEFPPRISTVKMNKYIKEVAALVPELKEKTTKKITKGGKVVIENMEKWEMVSTHTARRSYCTNEFLAGTPTLTIMAISGHTTEREFLKYIKLSQNDHAQQQQAIWERRDADNSSKSIDAH